MDKESFEYWAIPKGQLNNLVAKAAWNHQQEKINGLLAEFDEAVAWGKEGYSLQVEKLKQENEKLTCELEGRNYKPKKLSKNPHIKSSSKKTEQELLKAQAKKQLKKQGIKADIEIIENPNRS